MRIPNELSSVQERLYGNAACKNVDARARDSSKKKRMNDYDLSEEENVVNVLILDEETKDHIVWSTFLDTQILRLEIFSGHVSIICNHGCFGGTLRIRLNSLFEKSVDEIVSNNTNSSFVSLLTTINVENILIYLRLANRLLCHHGAYRLENETNFSFRREY